MCPITCSLANICPALIKYKLLTLSRTRVYTVILLYQTNAWWLGQDQYQREAQPQTNPYVCNPPVKYKQDKLTLQQYLRKIVYNLIAIFKTVIMCKLENSYAHSFEMIKSDNTLVQWTCNLCYLELHWQIFKCQYYKFYTCRACIYSQEKGIAAYSIGQRR